MAGPQSPSIDEGNPGDSPGLKRGPPGSTPGDDGGDDGSGRRSKRSRKLPFRLKDAVDVPGGEPLVLEETGSAASPPAPHGRGGIREGGVGGPEGVGYGQNVAKMMGPAARPLPPAMQEELRHIEHLDEVLRLLAKRHADCATKVKSVMAEHHELSNALTQISSQLSVIKQRYGMLVPGAAGGGGGYVPPQLRQGGVMPGGVGPHAIHQPGVATNGMGGEGEYQQLYNSLFTDNM